MMPLLDCLSNGLCHLFGRGQWIGTVRFNEALNTVSYTVTTVERCIGYSIWRDRLLCRSRTLPIRRLLICRSIEAIFLSKIIIIFKCLHLDSAAILFLSLLLSFLGETSSDMLMWHVNVWERQIPLADVPHNLLILPAHEIWSDAATSIYILEILLQNFNCRLINCVLFYFMRCNILRLHRSLGINQFLIEELLLYLEGPLTLSEQALSFIELRLETCIIFS